VSFRDWRLAALFVLAILSGLKYLIEGRAREKSYLTPLSAAWKFLAVFTLVSYLIWLKLFGIYRYLVPLEMLAGPLIVGCMLYLVRGANARRAGVVVLALLLIGTTRETSWGRAPFDGAYFEVAVPDVGSHSLVIMGPYDPMSYVIPFFRADTRFVSPWNNFLHFSQGNRLSKQIRDVVTAHVGPIYTLDMGTKDDVNAVLQSYGLARDESTCLPIRSNADPGTMRICRVHRAAPS
jgi:hypothetical protein